jgi:hypothetical protein
VAEASTAPAWPGADGQPIACREKLKMLADNEAELRQVAQDAFEDALLMGVDQAALRARLHALIDALEAPGGRGR